MVASVGSKGSFSRLLPVLRTFSCVLHPWMYKWFLSSSTLISGMKCLWPVPQSRGSVICLALHLDHLRFMTGHMAVDIYCTRHSGNMSWHCLNVQTDRCGFSTKALWSDSQFIHLFQHFFFKISIEWIRVFSIE